MKKILCLILAVMMVFTMMPGVAWADNPVLKIEGGGYTHSYGNGGNIGNGIFMAGPMTIYYGEEVVAPSGVSVTPADAANVEITPDGKVEFVPLKAGTHTMTIVYNNTNYDFSVYVDEHDVGNGNNNEGPGSAPGNIRLVDGEFNLIDDCTVVFDELPGESNTERTFYIVADAGTTGLNIGAEIIDHYRTMHNYNPGGSQRQDVAVTDDAINIVQVSRTTTNGGGNVDNPVFTGAVDGSGFENTENIYVLSATVNSSELKDFTFRSSGIVYGNLNLYDMPQGENFSESLTLAVCSSGFVKEDTVFGGVTSGNDIMFLTEPNADGLAMDNKTMNMSDAVNDSSNRIHLAVKTEKGTPELRAYARYFAGDRSNVYEEINVAALPATGTPDGPFTHYSFNLSEFYGHNDLVLAATVGSEGNEAKTTLTINKGVKYEFATEAFDVAESMDDYMNVARNEAFQIPLAESNLQKSFTDDGDETTTTVLLDADMGNKRSSNMPYNGGYYGTVIKLADGHRLKGIETTGYNPQGEAVTTYLDYLVIQSIFYKVVNTGDELDKEVFNNNYNNFQIPHRNHDAGEYMVQVDIGLAEFNYDQNAQKYVFRPYNVLEGAVTGYSNFADCLNDAFGRGNYEVSLINSCLYYDIFCAGSEDEPVQDLYGSLDIIGTVKFLTEADRIDNFAGRSNNVGIKPADDHSQATWGNYEFDNFNNTIGDSGKEKEHENNIGGFNGRNNEKVVGAYDFEMTEGEDFKGMLDVYIPVPENVNKPSDCKVYWMNGGKPIPMPARYVDGHMAFTTSHFSEYVLVADADDSTGGSAGGSLAGIGGALPSEQENTVTNQSGTTTTAPTTSADMSQSTTSKGGETTTTVDQTIADKIVENAVANKSEEVVIDATVKNDAASQSTKEATVELPTETIAQIVEKTEADVTIKTDVAEIKMDPQALTAVAEQAEGKSVSIVAEKVKTDAKEVRIELTVVSDGKKISDFKGGNVSVTVEAPKGKKDVVCVYIDEQEHWHTVPGTLNADGTYTFTTVHFSTYAIVDAEHAEDTIAAQKAAVKSLKFKLNSKQVKTKKGKKAIKLIWSDTDIVFDGVEFQRSLKKTSGYGKKPFYTTKEGAESYTNTSVKSGTRYYYRARGFVTIDGEKVYTKWSYKAWRKVK